MSNTLVRSDAIGQIECKRLVKCHATNCFVERLNRATYPRHNASICFWPILLKKSAMDSTAEKYALEIEIFTLSRGFRVQISRSCAQKRHLQQSVRGQPGRTDFFQHNRSIVALRHRLLPTKSSRSVSVWPKHLTGTIISGFSSTLYPTATTQSQCKFRP
jgi:hypothetical protein